MRTPGRKSRRFRTVRDELAHREARLTELERAHRRLQRLYEVSRQLASFHSVEQTIPQVIERVAQVLAVRSAVLVLGTAATTRTTLWRVEDHPEEGQAAVARARDTYAFLTRVGDGLTWDEAGTMTLPLARGDDTADPAAGPFIALPLVVDHGPIFGVLQIESERPLDEQDLLFANAVVNQLAIAIDRDVVAAARHAAAAAAQREQTILAQVGAAVTSTLDHDAAVAALARCAVACFADLCILDEGEVEAGAPRRRTVVFADEHKQQALAEPLTRYAPRPGWTTLEARVLAGGGPLLVPAIQDPAAAGLAHDRDHADLLVAAGVHSAMALPLAGVGVLTFALAESNRCYDARELALGEEIARQAALGLGNARLYEQARRATVARDNLLAVVSHDLKNPLGTILMDLEMLAPRGDQAPGDDVRRHLQRIGRSAQRMHRLIADLLDTASIEAGRFSVSPERLELAPALAETLDLVQPLAARKQLALASEVPERLPAVLADPGRIQQVLLNLLGNAIKFTPEGGRITVRAEVAGDRAILSVTDTGPGIAAEELPHLFERFWQARRTARLGTGLGLFIARGIVEAHGGTLWVESQPGEGSRFTFTLPRAPAAPRDRDELAVRGRP
jgi:signal transduction histidine kinase